MLAQKLLHEQKQKAKFSERKISLVRNWYRDFLGVI
jgi:hypothetical protein